MSSVIVSLVVGGVMTMLTGTQFVYEDLGDRSSLQQATRIALDRVQRDIMLAGVGLTPMLPVFPLVVPRPDGGVDLRANAESLTELLQADMTDQRTVEVANTGLFAEGDWLVLYDGLGSIEIVEVDHVAVDRLELTASTSKNYETGDMAALAKLSQISYYTTTQGGTQVLMRQVGSASPLAIATDVSNFRLRYFDDSQPPQEFTPDSPERQLRIRSVDVELAVELSSDRLQAADRPTFRLRAQVVPRALSIVRG